MTKIAYNSCFGGFDLSEAAFEALLDLKGIEFEKAEPISSIFGAQYQRKGVEGDNGYLYSGDFCEDRSDPDLIAVIEKLGDGANGMCAKLCIEDVPEGVSYRIDEYDGLETVMTRDDYNWKTA